MSGRAGLILALGLCLAGPGWGSLRDTPARTPPERLGARGFRLLIRAVGKCLELFR
jgi:hypothetical protein